MGIQFFLFLLQNIDCGYSLEAVLTCTHYQCFQQKYIKDIKTIFGLNFKSAFLMKISVYLMGMFS